MNKCKPIFIGITGGIGTGKTTVCKVFEALGIPVYYADIATKKLMQTHVPLIEAIKSLFGNEAYFDNNTLNRKYIANIVFNDKKQLEKLNETVHPFSIAAANNWAAKQNTKYVIKEAALLFETEAFHYVDITVGVAAPNALRIQRVMHRDNITRDEVIARMNNQMLESIKLKLCDHIIYNNDLQLVTPQVVHLHQLFTQNK